VVIPLLWMWYPPGDFPVTFLTFIKLRFRVERGISVIRPLARVFLGHLGFSLDG